MSERPASLSNPRPRAQVATLIRRELGRTLLGRRSFLIWLLLALPVAITVLRFLFLPQALRADVARSTVEFAQMFHVFILRFVVFFACAGLFMNLFRGEILDRSLHYLLLVPVRRDVLVAGKFIGGLVAAVVALGAVTCVSWAMMYLANGTRAGFGFMLSSTGIAHLVAYLATVSLACLGYGAVFLVAGLYFRNPILPAAGMLVWELLSHLLPPALKAFTVVHSLSSLVPVPPDLGPLAILVQPVAPWKAVLGLTALALAALALATWRARTLEISYAAE